MSEGATGSSRMAEFAGMPYRKLVRACDDGELNFSRIKNHRLWLKHEADKQARRQKELEAALKAQDNFTGNVVAERGPQLKD